MSSDGLAAYGLQDFPFAAAVAILFGIVLLRAQGTYWLGRAIAAGTARAGAVRRLEEGRLDRGISFLRRWGPAAVPFSFLTIGFQTVINLSAGVIRMPWPVYTLAMIPGCVAWAFIYATIGLATFLAVVGAAAGSPWGIAVLVVLLAAVALLIRSRRGRRHSQPARD